MKMLAFAFCAITLCTWTSAQELVTTKAAATQALPVAAFQWSETSFDFDKKKAGIPVSYEFRFKNTGMLPLIITSVKASCGCTVTAYTKEPVEKGASGFVRATYDAAKAGKFSKTIAVYANTAEGMTQLTIKGEIVE